MAVPVNSPVVRSRPSYTFSDSADGFHSVPPSSSRTKKSLVSVPGRSVKTPCGAPPTLASRARRPPTSTVISGAVSDSRLARSSSRVSGGSFSPAGRKLRNPSALGSRTLKVSASVCSSEASVRPGVNGTVTSCPAPFAAFSTAAQPPSTMRSASETFVPSVWEPLKSCRTCSSFCSTSASWAGSLTSQSFWGARRMRAPLAPPRLSVSRKLAAEAQAVATSWETDSPEASSVALRDAMASSPISSWSTAGTGSCHSCGSGTQGPR